MSSDIVVSSGVESHEQSLQKISVDRINLGKKKQILEIPNLLEIQFDSYWRFLQMNVPMEKRNEKEGLESVFQSFFPIEHVEKNIVLEYHGYRVGEEKCSEEDAFLHDKTYSVVLKADLRLVNKQTGEIKAKEVYMGDLPLMTPRGSFVINGSERVVVSQIYKSPGVVFSYDNKTDVYSSKIIPNRGIWLEFEIDVKKDLFYIRIDRKKSILLPSFLRFLGYETNEAILNQFYCVKKIDLNNAKDKEIVEKAVFEIVLVKDVLEPQGNVVIFPAGQEIVMQDVEKILAFGITEIFIIEPSNLKFNKTILNSIQTDEIATMEEAVAVFHGYLHAGELLDVDNAIQELRKLFFDPKVYNLGYVGRFKLNQKLYDDKKELNVPEEPVLNVEDIFRTIKYLLKVSQGVLPLDDIDHLGNRRVRSVGELLTNQFKIGFVRMEKTIRERMNVDDVDLLTPQKLISIKLVMAVIKEFFASSQLSQFMDQINPLSELTHKRRLNALGPGGLSRDRASFEVRDVHYTHYGKICPIETPEGPNIGLILSLCNYARVNHYGFLITPYRKVVDMKVTDEIEYLTAIEEDRYFIAQFHTALDANQMIADEYVVARRREDFRLVEARQIDYMDISPSQIISVSSSLIPFLEHNDANRSLMGSNMQRQGVPLLHTESPVVGTGLEGKVASDSGVCVLSESDGEVLSVCADEIVVGSTKRSLNSKVVTDDVDQNDISDLENVRKYVLKKYRRTNHNTCFNHRSIVSPGELVKQGDVLADGPACSNGELSLGKNVLVAFMSWEGYNFEDAIVLSQRLVDEDIFTSIYIEEFEVEVRETKLGVERVTKDIPGFKDVMFSNLDEDGIIRVGAMVQGGSVLVGKVTPKAEVESTPEYKLLRSIFGEKADEVKDTSLRVPHGFGKGIVVGVRSLTRELGQDLQPGVEQVVKIYVAQTRQISVGDKMAGRHGNKGVVSVIVPVEDMPFLEDGTPIDIVLNPLGVPSRMNIGQILEALLGWVGHKKKVKWSVPVFSGIKVDDIVEQLKNVGLPASGKVTLFDGKTGEAFLNPVTVGYLYMLKLIHMVEDKIHARSTGPYSLVTQQPLGGKSQFGGQRLGEMEVWALEGYGAAYALQEFLTGKADDISGRVKMYENIIKNRLSATSGIPESFNVLIQELRGLLLDLEIYDKDGEPVLLTEKDMENLNRLKNKIKF